MKLTRDMGQAAAVRPQRFVSRWDDGADVIVVGFGAAGACAAIEAARTGADVVGNGGEANDRSPRKTSLANPVSAEA